MGRLSYDDMVVVDGVQYRPEDVPGRKATDVNASGERIKVGPVTPGDMVEVDGVLYRPEDAPSGLAELQAIEAEAAQAAADAEAAAVLDQQVEFVLEFGRSAGVEFSDEQRQVVADLLVAEDLVAAQQVVTDALVAHVRDGLASVDQGTQETPAASPADVPTAPAGNGSTGDSSPPSATTTPEEAPVSADQTDADTAKAEQLEQEKADGAKAQRPSAVTTKTAQPRNKARGAAGDKG